ncbi:OLC1v1024461C1 [Oldenlandia corymbosa var. corymbosa]|uniref:OLC1v1024461C1 n=1 Tax=Oldenlandia corymbosa var. corymbosa TaxID=529605 RepID=A0AAV1C2S4_OLDCO|nr:OLC1v1024461C1 [Oldenlandia corymbosa var. corymbosa]
MEGLDLNVRIDSNSGKEGCDYDGEGVADVVEDVADSEGSLNSYNDVEEINDVDHVDSAIVLSDDRSLVEFDDRVSESLEDNVLIGRCYNSLEEAFSDYNSYAKRIGFSAKKFKDRKRPNAMVVLRIDDEGIWKVVQHVVDHCHDLVPLRQRHLIRSQREVPANDVILLSTLKDSSIGLIKGFSFLRNQARGVPNLGYTVTDARNQVAAHERAKWEGGDANNLLNLLKKRQETEEVPLIFKKARHRLCTWHIGENSKNHFGYIRNKSGFMDLFQLVLRHTDKVAEFEYYWRLMCDTYNCHNDKWLKARYASREKWCPAFSKSFFSGGALSSQRSETTNRSISQSLSKASRLCTFYHRFKEVVDGWRQNENDEDNRCNNGRVNMRFPNSDMCRHARELYTIQAYIVFEKEFDVAVQCNHWFIGSFNGHPDIELHHVRRMQVDVMNHQVIFNARSNEIKCTCSKFSDSRFLCAHCLRVYMFRNVNQVPKCYILQRFRRNANIGCIGDSLDSAYGSKFDTSSSFLWRTDMIKKFISLLSASESCEGAKKIISDTMKTLSDNVSKEVGSSLEETEEGAFGNKDSTSSTVNIKDPETLRPLGERNVRWKSATEIRSRKASTKHKKGAALRTRKTIYKRVNIDNPDFIGRYAHPLVFSGFDQVNSQGSEL